MKIELKQDQIAYWPKISDYSYRWTFEVFYEVEFFDKETYEFKTQFIFHSKERKIYYNNMTDYIPFDEINWEYSNYTDDEGNLQFGSTDSFIFYNTYYIGEKEIEENHRKSPLSGFPNPFNFSEDSENNELNYNRDVIRDWWKNNNVKIVETILENRELYNSQIENSLNDIKIKN